MAKQDIFSNLNGKNIKDVASSLKEDDVKKMQDTLKNVDKSKINNVVNTLGGVEQIKKDPEKLIRQLKENPQMIEMLSKMLK